MLFKELSVYLEKLEKTSSRLEITEMLSDLFKKTDENEIDKVTYLILGGLAPEYRGIVFNIADKLMLQVLSKTYNEDLESVKELYKDKGDLGEATYELAVKHGKGNKVQILKVNDVYKKLLDIANDSGADSVERKIIKTSELLGNLDQLSCKFVVRIPVGKLRLGFSDKTILDALSWMETGGKDKRKILEHAYDVLPDVGLLAKNVKIKGIDKTVSEIEPEVGTPILPMLMARLKSPKEMIEKMKTVMVEPKFDGLRIQLHYKKEKFNDGSQVKAFTRKPNEVSWMFPELSEFGKHVKAKEAIFDSEAIGVDEELKKMASFQSTMTRRRKHDINETAAKISMRFEIFDLMYKNSKSFVEVPYEERRKELAKTLVPSKMFGIVKYEKTKSPERIIELMEEELGEGLEGIAVKRADSKYVSGRTGFRWVKMKEGENQKAKLVDTMDLVVMGYYTGRGKRTTFGMGGFLVGVPDGEKIKTLTKIGTGLTDEQFKELKKRLSKIETKEKPKEYGEVNKIHTPDTWVAPEVVVEIAADEITKSPTHSSGFALRFPRLVKFRDDKDWNQATSLGEIKKLFKLQ